MIIYSEITGDIYDSVEECLRAEKETKQAEIDKAYEDAIAACDKYLKLVGLGGVDEVEKRISNSDCNCDNDCDCKDCEIFEEILSCLF